MEAAFSESEHFEEADGSWKVYKTEFCVIVLIKLVTKATLQTQVQK